MKFALTAIVALFVCVLGTSASAQTFTSIHQIIESKKGTLSAFQSPTLERILVAERVAENTYVMDALIKDSGVSYRVPLKISVTPGKAAKLLWAPDRAFLSGLQNLVQAKALVVVDGATPLGDQQKLPAFGVIVTPKSIISMFGTIKESPDDGTNVNMGSFVVPGGLVGHSNRWITDVLMGDPGPAFVDLYVTGNTSWKRANEAQFGVAMSGLDLIGWVGRTDKKLVSVTSRAPAGSKDSKPPEAVIALMVTAGSTEVRYSKNGEVSLEQKPCTDTKRDCVAAIAPLMKTVSAEFPATKRFMFAAKATLTVDQVLPFITKGLTFSTAVRYRSMVAATGADQ